MLTTSLSSLERRAILSLSLIMALRMIALFMALPLFALYASNLQGATPFLVGLAFGIYGLSQAVFQIPFGSFSDRYGRKPIIAIGLLIFIVGSFLSASATTIWSIIIGRSLQGSGAVGSTLLALLSDCTRTEKRTQAMAIAGISIGAAFGIAMLMGPFLNQWLTVSNLFFLAGIMGIIALTLLYTIAPQTHAQPHASAATLSPISIARLVCHTDLWRLISGIFILHTIFSASFIAIPFSLLNTTHIAASHQWSLYIPSLAIAFPVSFICIGLAERKQQVKSYFLGAIGTLLTSQLLFTMLSDSYYLTLLTLTLFFFGFSLLESFLPSLVSRAAPATQRGSALGLYSCAQFLGIFAGGILGGCLYGYLNTTGVYFLCILLCLVWLSFALSMKPSHHLT